MDTSDMSTSGVAEKILQDIEPRQLAPPQCVATVMSGNKGCVILKQTSCVCVL